MDASKVVLTKCNDYNKVSQSIEKQFAMLGGLEIFIKHGDTVLLKPNFIAPKSRRHAVQTDPVFLIEIAKLLKDFGAKPFIADSPAWTNTLTCARALKMEEQLKKLSIPIKQLNRPKNYIIDNKNTTVKLSSIAIEADAIINLPKFKSHQQLVATFAIKNMFGCVCGKRKALWHFKKGNNDQDFCELLINIYKFTNPVLTIIDAVKIMDGPGPIHGRARDLGWLIGGTDPIACETICAKLVNIEPNTLPIINTAQKLNYGCFDFNKIEILGDKFPEQVCMDFQQAEQIPIRFSLPRVCKSVYKQIWLKIKKHNFK